MPTVIATVGADDANSYIDVSYADTYLDGLLNTSAWSSADAATKARAVITATAVLDRLQFAGGRSTTTQALQWPRYETYDRDGWPFDSDEIPVAVKNATALLALELVKAGTTDPMATTAQDKLHSLSVEGAVELVFRARGDGPSGLSQFPEVLRELRTVLVAYGQTRFVRG